MFDSDIGHVTQLVCCLRQPVAKSLGVNHHQMRKLQATPLLSLTFARSALSVTPAVPVRPLGSSHRPSVSHTASFQPLVWLPATFDKDCHVGSSYRARPSKTTVSPLLISQGLETLKYETGRSSRVRGFWVCGEKRSLRPDPRL